MKDFPDAFDGKRASCFEKLFTIEDLFMATCLFTLVLEFVLSMYRIEIIIVIAYSSNQPSLQS